MKPARVQPSRAVRSNSRLGRSRSSSSGGGPSPARCSDDLEQRGGDVVGLRRAARDADDRQVGARPPVPAEVVGQAHRAGRVVAHRGDAAVGRARPDGHHGRGLRREPVDPLVDGDRLAVELVDAEARPVPLAAELLVGDRALEHEDERVELVVLGVVEGVHELVAVLEREHRVVHDDLRAAGDDAREEVLDARVRRGRHRDRVAVARQSRRDPQDVDDFCSAADGAGPATRELATKAPLSGTLSTPSAESTRRLDRTIVQGPGDLPAGRPAPAGRRVPRTP